MHPNFFDMGTRLCTLNKKFFGLFLAMVWGFASGQVTLPHTRTSWNSTPTGWVDTPLDSYTTTFACSGNNGAKFDTTGDLKTIFLDSAPDKLSFVVKSNTSTNSSLLVEQSSDGTNFTTLINLSGTSDLPTTCTTNGPYQLDPLTRYIKWTFTKGTSNMTMDDVTITKLACTTPTTPSGAFSGATTGCGSVPIVFTGTIPAGESYYWQSSANGTATTYPVTSGDNFLAPSAGTWYVRSKVAACWSVAQTGPAVTVSPAISIGTQPANQTVIAGNNVSFSVAATNAAGYQWQANTGTGFSNLSNGGVYSNTGTSTLNITGATTTMNNYQYRCVVTANAPCADASSNAATLTVNTPSVNTIPNQNNVYGSTINITPTATGAVSSWTATLPAGLSINTSSGLISGTLMEDVVNSPFSSSVTAIFAAGGADTKNFTWTITARPLSVSGLTGTNKIYDGNTSATVGGIATLNNKVGSDDVSLIGTPIGVFVSKDVANGININISGYTLSGTKAGNYTLTAPTTTANITKKALTIAAPSIATKVYNGTTASGLVTPGILSDLVGTETLNVNATGTYANANAETGKTATVTYSLSNGGNGGLAKNYSLANGTGTGDIAKASLTATADSKTKTLNTANPALTITYTGFVNSETTGTAAGFVAPIASTTAVINSPVGTYPITLSGGSAMNYNFTLVNGTLTVSSFSFQNGDVRPLYAGADFSYNSAWEEYNNGIWSNRAASPESTKPSGRIIIDKESVGGGGNASQSYPNDIIILNGAELYLRDLAGDRNYSSWPYFLGLNKSLTVQSGGKLILEGDIRLGTNTFTVEDNADFILDNPYMLNVHPIWAGTENFMAGSNVIIKNWNWETNNNTEKTLFQPAGLGVSNNASGYKFGNLLIDVNAGSEWTLIGGNNDQNFPLCYNNLEISNTSSNFITGTSSTTSSFIVNGDMIIYDGWFNFGTIFSSGNQSNNYTINGDFVNISDDKFKLHHNNGTYTGTLSGSVTVKGNIEIGPNVLVTNDGTKKFVLETGSEASPKFIDIAPVFGNTSVDVNTGYRRLKKDFQLGTNSKVTVFASSALDFGFDNDNAGTTPLHILRNGTDNGTAFEIKTGSILKITSPKGIYNVGSPVNYADGNVRVTTRTYNPAATYHYIGKENQETGNGLPNAAANKHVIVELANDNLEFISTNGIIRFNNPTTAIGSNFKGLEIRKGTVIVDDIGNRFEDSSTPGEKGNLKMTGGVYKIFTSDVQPAVSGNYDLSAGSKIVFAHTTATSTTQAIRGDTDFQYPEIEVTGKDVRYSNVSINMKANGLFTVKENARLTNTGNVGQIVSLNDANPATLTIENNGTFYTEKEKGFTGAPDGINPSPSVRTNHNTGNVRVVLQQGSVVNYSRNGDQIITNAALHLPADAHYENLTISGTGEKKIAAGKEVIVNNLTKVNAATLKVEQTAESTAPAVLTAKKGLQVANTANALFQNNAQLMQDADASNSGTITMNRIFQLSNDFIGSNGQTIPGRSQYNFIISPVTDQKIKSIYPGGVLAPYVIKYAEGADWFVNAGDGDYVPGKAYAIKEPKKTDFSGATSVTTEFKGKPANGDAISYTLQYGSAPNHVNGMDNKGWNLVGNPYPSNLDIEQLYDANDSKIEPTFQFWDNRGNIYTTQQGSNYVGHNYAYYNALNGTGVGSGGKADDATGEVRIPTKEVKVGTGFMVRALSSANGQHLEFKNAYRLTTSGPGFFGKGTENTNSKDRYWLEIATPDQLKFMTAMVYFSKGKYEFGIDDTESPEASDDIYSLADEHKLVIQGRPLFEDTDVVPLGVNAFKDGNYSIGVYKKDGIFAADQSIYLKDKQTGIVTDISNDRYTFSASAGSTIGRFEILYRPGVVLGTSNATGNDIYIYRDANAFVIRSSQKLLEYADLYDTSGRMLHRQHAKNSKEMRVEADKLADGIYLLKIRTQSGEELTKKVRK